MWARNLELMLGLWLALSPFILGHGPDETYLFVHDLAAGGAVVVLSLLVYHPSLRRIHLLTLCVGLWLIAEGWGLSRNGATPATQNHIIIGLLLAMLGIIPSLSSQPPGAWKEFLEERAGDETAGEGQRQLPGTKEVMS